MTVAMPPELIEDTALDAVHGGLLPAVKIATPDEPPVEFRCQNNLKQLGLAAH